VLHALVSDMPVKERLELVAAIGSDRLDPERELVHLLLADFEKILAPAVVEVRDDVFATAQLRHTLLASKALKYDAHLL
jgi:hypothetical protein